MCKYYGDLKRDFIYRGDIFASVPFLAVDPPIYLEAIAKNYARPDWLPEHLHKKRSSSDGVNCVAVRTRRPGIVISRTCEANRVGNKIRVAPFIHAAPIRPFADYDDDFVRGVIGGFRTPVDGEEPGVCKRFVALPKCADHGMQDGGMVCLRELQPVHRDFFADQGSIARLSDAGVRYLVERIHVYFAHSDEDAAGDTADEGEPSDVVLPWRELAEKGGFESPWFERPEATAPGES